MPAADLPLTIHRATIADVPIIAYHRAAMFTEMGSIAHDAAPALIAAATPWLADALPRGEYLGWLARPAAAPDTVVAGAGVQLRPLMPRPAPDGRGVLTGRQALVVNVYVEPAARRRGIARLLMADIIAWSREARIASLVLHASAAGRQLYESLGFVATNEMRFGGGLATDPAPPAPIA